MVITKLRYVNHPLSTSSQVVTMCYHLHFQCDNHEITSKICVIAPKKKISVIINSPNDYPLENRILRQKTYQTSGKLLNSSNHYPSKSGILWQKTYQTITKLY